MTDLREILAAATPGPWEADGPPWNRIVRSSSSNRVCFMAHNNGLDDVRDIATSNLVALAPDLAAEVLALREENAKLGAVLVDAGVLRDAADRVSEWFCTEARHLEGPRIQALRMAMVAYDRHMQPGQTAARTALAEIKALTGGVK